MGRTPPLRKSFSEKAISQSQAATFDDTLLGHSFLQKITYFFHVSHQNLSKRKAGNRSDEMNNFKVRKIIFEKGVIRHFL